MALQCDKGLANSLGKCFADILTTTSLAAMPEWALSCKLHHTIDHCPLYIPLVSHTNDRWCNCCAKRIYHVHRRNVQLL